MLQSHTADQPTAPIAIRHQTASEVILSNQISLPSEMIAKLETRLKYCTTKQGSNTTQKNKTINNGGTIIKIIHDNRTNALERTETKATAAKPTIKVGG